METRTCQTCGAEFRTSNGSKQCYSCHLDRITGGIAPEEGDFNSAHLAAGDWDETQKQHFQRSLRAIELGTSEDDPLTDLYDNEEDYNQDDDYDDSYEEDDS